MYWIFLVTDYDMNEIQCYMFCVCTKKMSWYGEVLLYVGRFWKGNFKIVLFLFLVKNASCSMS